MTELETPETEHFKCQIESSNPITLFENGARLNYICERKSEVGLPHYVLPTWVDFGLNYMKVREIIEENLKDKTEPRPIRGVFK